MVKGVETYESKRIPRTKPVIAPLELSSTYLWSIKYHLKTLPRVGKLQTMQAPIVPLLSDYIEMYFNKTDFSHNPRLVHKPQQDYLKQCMHKVYGRKNILFCIDVEAWELNGDFITEIGISIYDPRVQFLSMMPSTTQIHILIRENLERHNGRFVPDHARNFNGGTSLVMSEYEAACFIQTLINFYFEPNNSKLGGSLVGHDVKGDIKWFNQLGVKFPDKVDIIDTHTLFGFTTGKNGTSLKNALIAVDIPYAFLHNAGNDAYYTLLVLMKLCDPRCRLVYSLDKTKEEPESVESTPHPEGGEVKDVNMDGSKSSLDSVKENKPKKKSKSRNRLTPNLADTVVVDTALDATSYIFMGQ
ncbi:uncharacterized protein RJT20DRAFT_51633 [Scheffersomyces xylosifermentans]|uniref:uncharacterized protein n=1 Tax=Scheffersomyces xylosifermentans TaxID=1304137 RepID=UPI00315CA369